MVLQQLYAGIFDNLIFEPIFGPLKFKNDDFFHFKQLWQAAADKKIKVKKIAA